MAATAGTETTPDMKFILDDLPPELKVEIIEYLCSKDIHSLQHASDAFAKDDLVKEQKLKAEEQKRYEHLKKLRNRVTAGREIQPYIGGEFIPIHYSARTSQRRMRIHMIRKKDLLEFFSMIYVQDRFQYIRLTSGVIAFMGHCPKRILCQGSCGRPILEGGGGFHQACYKCYYGCAVLSGTRNDQGCAGGGRFRFEELLRYLDDDEGARVMINHLPPEIREFAMDIPGAILVDVDIGPKLKELGLTDETCSVIKGMYPYTRSNALLSEILLPMGVTGRLFEPVVRLLRHQHLYLPLKKMVATFHGWVADKVIQNLYRDYNQALYPTVGFWLDYKDDELDRIVTLRQQRIKDAKTEKHLSRKNKNRGILPIKKKDGTKRSRVAWARYPDYRPDAF